VKYGSGIIMAWR